MALGEGLALALVFIVLGEITSRKRRRQSTAYVPPLGGEVLPVNFPQLRAWRTQAFPRPL